MKRVEVESDLRRSRKPSLVADVGGSNARFGWLDGVDRRVQHIRSVAVADHAGFVEAAQHYIAHLRREVGDDIPAPNSAAIAVATAITGDRVELTNSGWTFSRHEAKSLLGLQTLHVLNDFEALALALPHLTAHQVHPVGPKLPPPPEPATLAVVGPGTGLGVACVVPTHSGWVALPGEGGHATLAAGDDFESELIAWVRRRYTHVSAERLLSGIGLPLLHAAVAAVTGKTNQTEDKTWDAPAIVDAGVAGDVLARQTLEVFCALLGGFAGNVALTVGARGGLFVGGGIVPRLGPLFAASRFRQRFEDKGRLSPYLCAMPTAVITDTLAALTGAAAALDPELSPHLGPSTTVDA